MRPDSPELPLIERRVLHWLFFFYCLFILYGTFIPFRFSSDPLFVRSQWQHFFTPPYVTGGKQFSILDVTSNVLLFFSFGFLWVGSEIGKHFFGRLFGAVFGVGLLGGLFGLGIELGQVYSPGRTASILDALCNGSGAAIGGFSGYLVFHGQRGVRGQTILNVIRRRPALLVLGILMIVPLADAYYPFQITLDVSTIWHNLKRTQWIPFAGGFHRYWLDLVIEKVLLFAAIGYLAVTILREMPRPLRAGSALVLCIAFAFYVEGGKLLFVGRIPNAENFLLAAAGALFGVTIVPALAQTPFCRRHPIGVLLSLVIAILAYAELSPFDWIQSADELPRRVARIEWLPLGAYYGADPLSALFDLGKKLLLAGPLGFLLAARRRTHRLHGARLEAASAGFLLGGMLEALQILLRSRTPSVTDMLLFAATSWSGAVIFRRFAKLRDSGLPASNWQQLDSERGC